MFTRVFLDGAIAAVSLCGQIPPSLSKTLQDAITDAPRTADPSSPAEMRTDVVNCADLPPAARKYLLDTSSTKERSIDEWHSLPDRIEEFAVVMLSSMAGVFDRRLAIKIERQVPEELRSSWRPLPLDDVAARVVRDAYIHLSKRDDMLFALGWYLALFATREFDTSFHERIDERVEDRDTIYALRELANSSSRATASGTLLRHLRDLIDE